MLVVMNAQATAEQTRTVCEAIAALGFEAAPMPGGQRVAIGVIGNDKGFDDTRLRGLPGVHKVIHVSKPYKLVSREFREQATVIEVLPGIKIGGPEIVVMGGPCSVESEKQLMTTAEIVRNGGGLILRGGAFKPRSSPYSFQGLGIEGLRLLAKARDEFGLAVVTEAMDIESANAVAEYADIIQIGARNMQNFPLLKHVGKLGKPVMLKRGMSATIKEWLLAAEYVAHHGNPDIILCERGIRSFGDATRNVMDVGAIAVAKVETHLPIIGDPSHATGRRDMVLPVGRAAIAAGADGVIVETHPEPNQALSDGPQALYPEQFVDFVEAVRLIAGTMGRPLATPQRLRGR
jgi:3-deoxy-7-phosphoheptulonate synthase